MMAMAMATTAILLMVHGVICADLQFPRAVYKASIAVADDECRSLCRLLLYNAGDGSKSLVREYVPSAVVVLTGLESGRYDLDVNCSSPDDDLRACRANPLALSFHAADEFSDRVTQVGSMSLHKATNSSSVSTSSPRVVDPPRQPAAPASLSKWQFLAISAILAVQWTGLRLITAFTNKTWPYQNQVSFPAEGGKG